jgi:hypothetical protein
MPFISKFLTVQTYEIPQNKSLSKSTILKRRVRPEWVKDFLSYSPLKTVWADLPTAVRVRVNGATLLQMSLEVIQYHPPTALEDNQYPLAKDQRVLAFL